MTSEQASISERIWRPRAPREKVMLGAVIERFGPAPPTQHRVRDLSITGARVDRAGSLEAGATIVITIGALQAIGATIVWTMDDMAGLKFAEPIDVSAAHARTYVQRRGAAADPTAQTAAGPIRSGWASGLAHAYRSDRG
jgi:hypothetical protein